MRKPKLQPGDLVMTDFRYGKLATHRLSKFNERECRMGCRPIEPEYSGLFCVVPEQADPRIPYWWVSNQAESDQIIALIELRVHESHLILLERSKS